MKEPIYILDNDREDSLYLKENLLRYFSKWPWFLLSLAIFLLAGYLFIRYAPVIYTTEAKVKIIDDSKELDLATDALSLLGGSKINLDNEIAVITSYRLVDQVVDALHLDVSYHEVGNVKSQQVYQAPVIISKLFADQEVNETIVYTVHIEENSVEISDINGTTISLDSAAVNFPTSELPVQITLNPAVNLENHRGKEFQVQIKNKKETVLQLIDDLEVRPMTEKSDVLSLRLENESAPFSEAILNSLIEKFNRDGVLDRQLVSKRTLDFIDERFVYLSEELDSIESDKKEYKQDNNLSYIQADASITIEKKAMAESEVFRIETQIELSKLLKQTLVSQTSFSLLPADIGVENTNINSLVYQYNEGVLQREKLTTSAGVNNPTVQVLSSQLATIKNNIIGTVNGYQDQLSTSLRQLKRQEYRADATFAGLPDQEQTLRAIERQQGIKENLFLLLLQKREEASINFAVTAPSIKVVDYGLTKLTPVFPKKLMTYGLLFLLGIFMPLAFFFTKFSFDTKIKTKADLERLSGDTPLLAEIPTLKNPTTFFNVDDKSMHAEAFRILSTNMRFVLPKKTDDIGQFIYVTSSIKGEGKTLISLNLAVALAGMKKKVLLVGADLRNPRLHDFFKIDKNVTGLSNYLHDPTIDWKDSIQSGMNGNPYLDLCISGPIPPNAAQLLGSDALGTFFEEVKHAYDYIVVDTAPTIQVADTLLMSEYADLTLFVTRAAYTDKRLILFSQELNRTRKIKNMAYVINDAQYNSGRGYNYGYEYGY